MRRTQLFIDNGNGYQEVDLYDNIDIQITYNVADVRDISKKDSNFSLTVKLPNTNNNAQIFDVIHEIARYNSTFEMLKQYPAFIEVDCNKTFEGYFKLTKVVINNDQEISYEGNLYSNVIEFMKRLGTTTLRDNADAADDLSFSEYTTTLDVIRDSTDPDYPGNWFERTDMYFWDKSTSPWTPISEKPYGKDFYFAPVDKFNFTERNILSSDKNNFPMFFDEFTPFLFYKEIWDKLFKWAGFSYVSDFIQNTANNTTTFEFEKLVYPATSTMNIPPKKDIYSILYQDNWFQNPLFPNYVYDNYDKIATSWDGTSTSATGLVDPMFRDTFLQLGVDEVPSGNTQFGQYTDYLYTFSQAGIYSLKVDIPYKFQFELIDLNGNFMYNVTDTIDSNTHYGYVVEIDCIYKWIDSNNVTHYETLATDDLSGNYESSYDFNSGIFVVKDDGVISIDRTITAVAGAQIYFTYRVILNEVTVGEVPLDYPIFRTSNTLYGIRDHLIFKRQDIGKHLIDINLISDFTIGGIFDPTVILNPKRKKVDFVSDIIKKFNLYIEDVTNKKDANGHYYRDTNYYPVGDNKREGEPILRIEPRPLYYKNEEIVKDFTSKTDVGTVEFNRIDDYLYNQLLFNDKDDKTYHVEDYNNYNYTEGEYGEEIITSPFNTSNTNKTEVKTELGQTMCGIIHPKNIQYDANQYLQCPYIFTLNDKGVVKTDKEYEDRMLFVNDLYYKDYEDTWNGSAIKGIRLYERNNSYYDDLNHAYPFPVQVRTYCLLDHFNIPFGHDDADLNFGQANWYYQNLNGTWATHNNCYNVFYKDMIDSYNSPDSRLMTCKMYLSPTDIRDLKLSDTIIVNNVAYHINKIKQWKNENEPVQVELIKILQGSSKTKLGNKTNKHNSPPQLKSPIDVSALKNDVATLNKIIDSNTDELKNNTKLIASIKDTLTNFEERLKKLESS